jgi:hypothetical protein
MGEQVFVKYSGSTRGGVLRAHAKNMGGVTTKHTTAESSKVAAAEASNRVGRVVVFHNRLVAGHRLFCRRDIHTDVGRRSDTSEGGHIIGGWELGGRRLSVLNGRDGVSGGDGAMLGMEASGNGLVHDAVLSSDVGMMADSTHTESTKGCKLGSAGSEGGERRGHIGNVGNNEILDVHRQTIVVLIHQIESPEVDTGGKERNKAAVGSKEFVRGEICPDASTGIAVTHGEFFQSLDSGVKRSSVIAISGPDIISAEEGNKKLELAAIGESRETGRDGEAVNSGVTRMGQREE